MNSLVEEIYFEHKRDAEDVLKTMREKIDTWGDVSLGDMRALCGISRNHKHDNYGWVDLSFVKIEWDHLGWHIDLPELIGISKQYYPSLSHWFSGDAMDRAWYLLRSTIVMAEREYGLNLTGKVGRAPGLGILMIEFNDGDTYMAYMLGEDELEDMRRPPRVILDAMARPTLVEFIKEKERNEEQKGE